MPNDGGDLGILSGQVDTGLQPLAQAKGATIGAVIGEAVDRDLETASEPDWRARRLGAGYLPE